MRAKRALLAGAVLTVAATCLLVVLAPRFWPVAAAGVAGALAGNTLAMAVAAISLGIVGPTGFARRAARNEALFHAGNAALNLTVLATAPLFGIAVVFWLLTATVLASVVAVLAIPAAARSPPRQSTMRSLGVCRPRLPGTASGPRLWAACWRAGRC